VLDSGTQDVARGAACCLSKVCKVVDRGAQAQAASRGVARCALQVTDRGAQAVARGALTLPRQEKNNSVDVQQNSVNITGFTCRVAI
jgi:hypothetical protein